MTSDERTCLMRCSTVRKFDEPLFFHYFQYGDVRLEDLVSRHWVETDNKESPRYWISRSLRDAAWDLWWPPDEPDLAVAPTGLRALSAEAADYCQQKGWDIEQLRQEAVAGRARAESLFDQLLREADARFDLAYCQDLVDALTEEERSSFISQALRDRRDAAQRRITTRSLRDGDYYQTRKSRFQPRVGAQEALGGLLARNPDYWLVQLHGAGGIGKTTLLRWFVSRECVTADQTVPAAIINCDDFDAATILSQPWLLLIEAAEQLNDQLPEVPFRDLVSDRDKPSQGTSIASAVTDGPRRLEHIGQQVENNFCANACTGIPFVIALDGLDFISLESRAEPKALRGLVALLRRVHSRVRDLRIVLSGRDDLSKLVPELADQYVRHQEVRKFTEAEADEYLDRRGITDQDKIAAIREKSDLLPMVVGLYADWLVNDDSITARQIKENSEPQASYLVTRILKRIPNAIMRYSLLYSVTTPLSPALDFEYFRDVLLPAWRMPLADGQQRGSLDIGMLPDPDDVPGPDDVAAQDQLWAELLQRAEQAKWISVVDLGGEKVIKVHTDVRLELLSKLRSDGTVRRIHELAAGYYQLKADLSRAGGALDAAEIAEGQLGAAAGLAIEQQGTNWPALTARMLYHRIQQGDPTSIARWRDTVRQSRDEGRIDWIRDLAGLVIRQPDFLDATALLMPDGASPPLATTALPDLEILLPIVYESYVELARIAAQAAGLLPGPEAVTMALDLPLSAVAIENARAVRSRAGARGVLISRADYEPIVSALNAVVEKQFDAALHELDVATEFGLTAETANGDACLVRARAYTGRYRNGVPAVGVENLSAVFGAFAGALRAHAADLRAATYVAVDAAQWLLTIDRPDWALQWCERAPDIWRAVHPAGTAVELKARALLALGMPASAIEVLSPPAGMVTTSACSLAVMAQLALYRPDLATMEDSGPADDLPSRRIERELLGAEAARELLDPNAAEACFGRAQACLLLLGQADEGFQARINTAQALFELRATGNLLKARAYLKDEFDQTSVGEPTWTKYQLARAELADRRGHGDRVVAILDEVRQHLRDIQAPASAQIRAAIAGLAARSIGLPERRKCLESLVDDLAEVTAPARIAMLTGLMNCLPIESGTAEDSLGERLRDLVTAGKEDPDTSPTLSERTDLAWRNLVVSQVFRVTGKVDIAERLRAEALWQLGDDPFARWRLLGARPEPRPEPRLWLADTSRIAADQIQSPRVFGEHYDRYPVLIAAYVEEWASRQRDPWAYDVSTWLAAAQESLDHSPWLRQTAWQAKLYQAIAARERPFTQVADPEADEIWIALGVKEFTPPTADPSPETSLPPATGEIIISGVDRGRGVRVNRGAPGSEGLPGGLGIDVTRFRFDIDRPTQGWATELGRVLTPVMGALPDSNVRLDLRRPVLAADPWELAVVGDSALAAHLEVRSVFRTASSALSARHVQLVQERVASALPRKDSPRDTQEWRDTIESLREGWARGDRRPLRVRLIHPMLGGSLDSERRFGERRRELERLYRAAFPTDMLSLRMLYGSQVSSLYSSPLDFIERQAQDWADVIHLCTVMEATEQMPVLDLEIADGPPLTARQLDLLVQRLTEAPTGSPGAPPLVVLDVFAPPSPVEARRQLLMRNRFAQQLLTLGSVGTVIATGLGGPNESSEQWKLIVTGLARGQNAARICRSIQRHSFRATERATATQEATDAQAIAFPATALFTSVHPDRLVPPGLLPLGLVG